MEMIKAYLTNNPYYKKAAPMNPRGIFLHSVGCSQPKAEVFIKSWNKPEFTRACVHAFIDANTGTIYKTLPWDIQGIHTGKTATNKTHIGIEMCEPPTNAIRYVNGVLEIVDRDLAIEYVRRTWSSAVKLFASLCEAYKLNPFTPHVILSHSEAHKLGLASNHGDPEHLWNSLKIGYDMNSFREAVSNAMNKQLYRVRKRKDDILSQLGAFQYLASAKALVDANPEYSVFDKEFNVVYSHTVCPFPVETPEDKVTLSNVLETTAELNMRYGAGTSKPIKTVLKKGTQVVWYGEYTTINDIRWFLVHTIDDEQGYISSNYVKGVGTYK